MSELANYIDIYINVLMVFITVTKVLYSFIWNPKLIESGAAFSLYNDRITLLQTPLYSTIYLWTRMWVLVSI